jgi:hypothetical protein
MLIQLSAHTSSIIESCNQILGSLPTIEIHNRERQAGVFFTSPDRPKRSTENNDEQQGQQKKLDHFTAIPDQDL